MNNIVSFLIKHLGIQELVDIALPLEIEQLRHENRPAIVRSLTLSENAVRLLCAKSGGDFAAQMVRRDVAANAFADLVIGFAPTGEPNAAA